MKKKLLIIVLSIILLISLVACSEAEISSTLVVYSDLSGTKTVVCRVYGDQEALEGRDYTPGNNTAFMLSTGDDLVDKLYEFSELKDVRISVDEGKTDTESTYITLEFDFDSIEDYNTKAKTLAGKNSESWIDATVQKNGNEITVKENASNLPLLYLDILEKYFNDFDCYPIYEYGPDTRSQAIPSGIAFSGDDLYSFTWWIVPTSQKIVVGNNSQESIYYNPSLDYNERKDLTDLYTEVTAVPNDKPTIQSITLVEGYTTTYEYNASLNAEKLLVSYSDGSSKEIKITTSMVSGFDSSKPGKQTLTVTYQDVQVSYDITVLGEDGNEVVEKKGCGSSIALSGVASILGISLLLVWRRKNEKKC